MAIINNTIGSSPQPNQSIQSANAPSFETKEYVKAEIEKQVQTDKASLITVFGTFASILAFLTVEFQFLKTINTLEKITGFTLILFSLLISFNLILDYVIKLRTQNNTSKPNITIFVAMIIILLGGIYLTSRNNFADMNEWKKQNEELSDKIKNYEGRLDQLQKQIEKK
jgi:hypothetical protein